MAKFLRPFQTERWLDFWHRVFASQELGLTLVVFFGVYVAIFSLLSLPLQNVVPEYTAGMQLEEDVVVENDLEVLDQKAVNEFYEQSLRKTGLYFELQDNVEQQAFSNLQSLVALFQENRSAIRNIEAAFEKEYRDLYAHYVYFELYKQKHQQSAPLVNRLEELLKNSDQPAFFSQLPAIKKQSSAEQSSLQTLDPFANPDAEKNSFVALRQAAEKVKLSTNARWNDDWKKTQQLGLTLSLTETKVMAELLLDAGTIERIKSFVYFLYQRPFVSDKSQFAGQLNYKVNAYSVGGTSFPLGILAHTPDVNEAFQIGLNSFVQSNYSELQIQTLKKFLPVLCPPILIYNRSLTELERKKEETTPKMIMVQLKRGEILAAQGELLDAEKAYLINLYALANSKIIHWPRTLSLAALIFFWLASLFLLLRMRMFRVNLPFRNWQGLRMALVFLAVQLFLSYGVLKLSNPVFQLLSSNLQSAKIYLLPVSLSAMLGILLLRREVAIFLAGISALLSSLLSFSGSFSLMYVLGGPLLAIYTQSPGKLSSRNQIIFFGVKVAFFNMLLALLSTALDYPSYQEGFPVMDVLIRVGLSFTGSLLSILVIMVMLPLLEQVFDIKTDMKLLELGNSNHPLLIELMQKAPGSYHHSIAVGTLAEAGAMKIGANSLFCRVAAYYHDIGKIENAGYFVENMGNLQNNPHIAMQDPVASTQIILQHVDKGVALAEKHRLGREIITIIREHHGTSLVRYFYNEYKKMVAQQAAHINNDIVNKSSVLDVEPKPDQPPPDKRVGELPESDFRYAGPKPQSIESAIIMLADVCEASCRSLPNPTGEQIQTVVRAVSNHILEDGQLDESRISLKDFKSVQRTFIDLLQSQYHARIQYPKMGTLSSAITS